MDKPICAYCGSDKRELIVIAYRERIKTYAVICSACQSLIGSAYEKEEE